VEDDQNLTLCLVASVTDLTQDASGAIAVCGSHGGTVAATFAARCGVAGALFNDAGVGLDGAGIAGLTLLDQMGVPAGTVSHLSARIGVADDTLTCGVLSYTNKSAEGLGCYIGMAAREFVRLVNDRKRSIGVTAQLIGPPERRERRHHELCDVVVVDSASQLHSDADSGCFIVTGSHGGLPDANPDRALRVAAAGALFNDAGGGRDGAGFSRLAPLDLRGVPSATVAASTARIGDGQSSLRTGVISHVNETASSLGVRPGTSAAVFAELIAGRPSSSPNLTT
jgi:hypothetical protein